MKTGRILVASGGAETRAELRAALEFEGHFVTLAETASQTIEEVSSGLHEVLLLDAALDQVGPYELCRAIRPKSDMGIMLLSSDDCRQNRIDALNAGADDYVPARFILPELLARVRALRRRIAASSESPRQLVLQDRAIDFQSHEIKGPGDRVAHLTPKECLLLEHFVAHANQPFTAQTLAQMVWRRDGSGQLEYVRVVVQQLRRKLEPEPDRPRYILTQRSVGYQFQMPPLTSGPGELV